MDNIREFAVQCTFHGISDIAQSKTWFQRLVWIALTVAGVALFVHGSYNTINGWLEEPLVSSFSMKYSEGLELPGIIFCPYPRFSRAKAEKLGVDLETARFLQLMYMGYRTTTNISRLNLTALSASNTKLNDTLRRLNTDHTGLARSLSFSCHDLQLKCSSPTFGNINCCDEVNVNYNNYYGICFSFSGIRQTINEAYGGIEISAIIPTAHEVISAKNMFWAEGAFARLSSEPQDGIIASVTGDILLPNGHATRVALASIKYELLNHKTSPCIKEDESTKLSKSKCIPQCVAGWTNYTCGCELLGFVYSESPIICGPYEVETCALPASGYAMSDTCLSQCKQGCSGATYMWSSTSIKFSADLATDANSSSTARQIAQKVSVTVYYERLDFLMMTQRQALETSAIIADLGGLLGLWLGGSLLSIVQLFVFLLGALHTSIRKSGSRSNSDLNASSEAQLAGTPKYTVKSG